MVATRAILTPSLVRKILRPPKHNGNVTETYWTLFIMRAAV